MKILVTGSAGFIGAHLCAALKNMPGVQIYGVDDFNSYYDPKLKEARLSALSSHVEQHRIDISDFASVNALLARIQPEVVIHLAAQAGVRHSFSAPEDYVRSNLTGQISLLEAIRSVRTVKRLIYASSSSVYSGVRALPFSEDSQLGTPKSLYAATKIADEVFCDTYSALYDIDMIGLRFFTVYGPWGRPDMAYWIFCQSILAGQKIKLFNHGNVKRDFTYVDDVIAAIVQMVKEVSEGLTKPRQHRLYNIGNHRPEPVGEMIRLLEDLTGRSAIVEMAPLPKGDMVQTFASVSKLQADYEFRPTTSLHEGISAFVDWYLWWMNDRK
ncbi:MAG: NAD-dependent epimerase/dehydratase family protein [Pseudomonadota bacterium]